MLKLLKKYLELNEEHWMKHIKKLRHYIEQLQNDRDFLLSKATRHVQNIDLKRIINNNTLSEENLADHKRLIN